MSGIKLKESWLFLLKSYRQLPYITIKKYSKHYIVPHRPTKPGTLNFNIARQKIKEQSQKYNQYYSTQNIWDKVFQKYEEQVSDSKLIEKPQAKHLQAKMKEYLAKNRQYDYKYKEPLQLMAKNAFFIFKRQEYRRLKEEEDKNNEQVKLAAKKISQKSDVSVERDESAQKRANFKNSLANLTKMRKMNLSQKWKNLTDQQRQVYFDLEAKMKAENEQRVQKFIENHQVPQVKRYSVIGRFTTRYASINGLTLKDKKLYEMYYALSQTERKTLKEEAIRMNQQSKQRYLNFLKKWGLSHEQLKNMMQVCDKYHKGKIEKMKATKKKNLEVKNKIYWEDDEEDFDDIETQNQGQI